MKFMVGFATKRKSVIRPVLRWLACVLGIGVLGVLVCSGVRAADRFPDRGALAQKNARRQPPGKGDEPTGTPLFSPIPKSGSFTITNPIIMITPAILDFGFVAPGKTATNTFLVENVGHGRFAGTASVAAPFKIDSGGKYIIRENEAQVVTVVYSPRRARVDTVPVIFTAGGTSVKATATGRSLPQKK